MAAVKSVQRNRIGAAAGGEERRLVHEVGEVGAGEARRQGGDLARRSTSTASFALRMCTLRIWTRPMLVRPVDQHLPVEAAGAQQRGVEDLRPVGGREQDQALARIEAVELDQELVQRLLLLVVAARQAERRGRGRARRARR